MSSNSTIISLALLKVNFDHQQTDYVDYLLPFVRYVLARDKPDPVVPGDLSDLITGEFGLRVPVLVLVKALKRLVKLGFLKAQNKVFTIEKEIDIGSFEDRRNGVKASIELLMDRICETASDTLGEKWDSEKGMRILDSYLRQFSIDCLSNFSGRSASVNIDQASQPDLYVVNKTFLEAAESDPETFDRALTVIKGYMLSNALLCEDLSTLSQKLDGVYFYFDTPLVLSLLELNDEGRNKAAGELVSLLQDLRGKACVFSHTIDEVSHVLAFAAANVDHSEFNRGIIVEMRRRGMRASDVLLLKSRFERLLNQKSVITVGTPACLPAFQIDERELAESIGEEVNYQNPRALEYDINSIRSIYALRGNHEPRSLENCKAIFVTDNSGLARTAFRFGKRERSSHSVSPVITAFSLANVAWLKSPMNAPDVPKNEILAACYAAMEPKAPLWNHYQEEIERLKSDGAITPEDHHLLKFSPAVQRELVDLTHGDDSHLTSETVRELLERVKLDLVKEKQAEVNSEAEKVREVSESLEKIKLEQDRIQNKMIDSAKKRAVRHASIIFFLSLIVTAAGAFSMAMIASEQVFLKVTGYVLSVVFTGLTLLNLFYGESLASIKNRIAEVLQKKYLDELPFEPR